LLTLQPQPLGLLRVARPDGKISRMSRKAIVVTIGCGGFQQGLLPP
jgi:hypothetical protein